MKIHFKLCFLLFFGLASIATSGQVCLKVVDSLNQEPLPYAIVEDADRSRTTSVQGLICLERNDKYIISFLGYEERVFHLPEGLQDTFWVKMRPSTSILSTAVVSGNRSGERLIDAIAPLDILSSEIISSRSTPSIEEHINRLPGVQMIDGQISIRGGAGYAYGAGSRVALLLNGVPMILPDAGSISWGDLPIELVDRVELVKGPAATLYGSAALNGVLQLNTWSQMKDTSYTELLVGMRGIGPSSREEANWYEGLIPSLWGHVVHKDGKGPFTWQGSIRAESNQSHYKDSFDERYRASFLGKYQWKQAEYGIQVLANRFRARSFLYWENTSDRIFFGDPVSELNDHIYRIQIDPYVKWKDHRAGKHSIQTRLFHSNNAASADRGSRVTQYLSQYQYDVALWGGKAKLTSGALGQAFLSEAALFGDNNLWSYQAAVFSRYELSLLPNLRFFGGLRGEYNSQQAGTIVFDGDTINANAESFEPIFSAGIHYDLWKGTAVSLHFGEGYRFPSIAEKFITTSLGPTAISPNPFLTDETGDAWNLSVKQVLKARGVESFLRLDLFWMRYQNMIEFGIQNPMLGFQALNVGDTDIKGLELSWMGEWKTKNLRGQFLSSYTYIDPLFADFERDSLEILARSSADYNVLKYRVRHQFSLQNTIHWKHWQLGFALLYNSDMEAIDRILELFVVNQLGSYRSSDKGAFFNVDVSFGYELYGVHFLLDIQNIFNNVYSLRPGLIEPPRSLNFQIRYRF
jgi:iron complex outermembrane receptor protein